MMPFNSDFLNMCRFKFIPKWDQLELLSIYGECIGQVEDADFAYTLFWLDSFFVEIVQDTSDNEVVNIWHYTKSESLNKYTQLITVADLYDLN